jgi:hypothetical protein
VRTRNTRAGIFWELPLGRLLSPDGSLLRNNKREKASGERNRVATEIDPSNPFDPPHPDETSVSVACLGAVQRPHLKQKKGPGKIAGPFYNASLVLNQLLVRVTLTVWPQKDPVTVAV